MHKSFLTATAIKWDKDDFETSHLYCFKGKSNNTTDRQLRGYEIDTLLNYSLHKGLTK